MKILFILAGILAAFVTAGVALFWYVRYLFQGKPQDEERNVVLVDARPGFEYLRVLEEGESWIPHPDGGIIVVHPDRLPRRCWIDEDTNTVRQDIVRLSTVCLPFDTQE